MIELTQQSRTEKDLKSKDSQTGLSALAFALVFALSPQAEALSSESTKPDQSASQRRQGPLQSEQREVIAANKPDHEQIKVLTFNIAEDGKFGLPGVIDLIRNSNADIVGLQESGPQTAAKIADALGFHVVHHESRGQLTTILTRFDIDSVTAGGDGIITHTKSGKRFAFLDTHTYYKPYQPYQLLGIPYDGSAFIKTEAEAITEAKKARGADIDELRKEIASLKNEGLPTILVGDFNEPSFLDWTDATAKAGRHPIKVEWPASKALADDGFKDSYREIFPNEIEHPGYTWTPTTKPDDPKDHHDRIDWILYRGNGIKLKSVDIIAENAQNGDVVVTPFPSDHRAVEAVLDLSPEK